MIRILQQQWRILFANYPLGLIVLLACVCCFTEGSAQTGERRLVTPAEGDYTLSQLLDDLELNLLDYRKSIPNLICTEKAEVSRLLPRAESGLDPSAVLPSEMPPPVESIQRRESSFGMRRVFKEGSGESFEESRIVIAVDGRPPTAANFAEPSLAMIYGVFSNALNILSKDGRACYGFRISSRKKKEILVDFVDLPEDERGAACAKAERTTGKITVDAVSMHITRISTRIPHHQLIPGLFGSWDWSEELAPIKLMDREFWLPQVIRSRSASDDRAHVWKLTARYSNYRLFHSDARIVP